LALQAPKLKENSIVASVESSVVRVSSNPLRRMYDWVAGLAERPHGVWALFLVAFAESSFFPIPPDVLLLALAVSRPRRSFLFAAVCTAGSVLGAALGYLIGLQFYEMIGRPIIDLYGAQQSYQMVRDLYQQWDAIAVGVAGFTPIPYKVFTIAAGAFEINFLIFMLASLVSRAGRFFLVGGLIWWLGPGIQRLIDRYFNLLTVIFAILLVGGFVIVKYVI
jgi:membrane protein YqaA with SNARE-associated domain